MKNRSMQTVAGLLLAILAGCIASDQMTVITLHADGAADWVKFQANIRSTEAGTKGEEELRRYIAEFDAHQDADHRQIVAAGGEVRETRWLRREEPCANLMVARFPSASALLDYLTPKGEKGEVIARPTFTRDGNRRRLALALPVPKDEKPAGKPELAELRQEAANGVSEIRLVVAGGRIVAAQGFIVAADKRSALIGTAEVRSLLAGAREKAELFLEWELTGN